MRLFTGFPVKDEVREYLQSLQEILLVKQPPEWAARGALRLVTRSRLHLTLQFLGEVPRGSLEQLRRVIAEFSFRRIEIRVGGLGCFQTGRRGGVIWAAVEPRQELFSLERQLRSELQQLGFESLREDFIPHITLARYAGIEAVAEVEQFVLGLESSLPLPCRYEVEELYLMESLPGAQYPIQAQCRLTKVP